MFKQVGEGALIFPQPTCPRGIFNHPARAMVEDDHNEVSARSIGPSKRREGGMINCRQSHPFHSGRRGGR